MADEETPSLRKRFRIAAFSAAEEAPKPAADVPVGKPSVAFQQAVVPPRTPSSKSDAPKEEKGLLRRGRNKRRQEESTEEAADSVNDKENENSDSESGDGSHRRVRKRLRATDVNSEEVNSCLLSTS